MQILKLTDEAFGTILTNMLKRSPDSYPEQEAVVSVILADVRENGDKAVFNYTKKFDGADISSENFIVTEEEEKEAYEKVDPALIDVIRKSISRIRTFHEKERQKSWFMTEEGMVLGQKVTPLSRVGVYVPGGKAAYPSSVLMNVIPAQVAGVPDIVMCTPPGKDGKVTPTTLVAAKEAGVGTVYKVGGAQAIAAMAFGTESLPRVDKITGPGNIFVALAKKAVYGHVSIDSVAGPSEVTVLADETANARYWRIVNSYNGTFSYDALKAEDARYADLGAFKNKGVIYCNMREKPFYENMPVQPDVVLADLIHIFHPELLPADYQPVYYELLP